MSQGTLAAALDAFRAEWIAAAPVGRAALYDAKVRELQDSGILDRALGVGDLAPDFALSEADGRDFRLSRALRSGPVVLTFYRGGWCPYCNIQLRAYQRFLPEITRLGARLAAVSPQLPGKSLATAEANGLGFTVASDGGNRIAKAFGLAYPLAEELRRVLAENGKALPDVNGDDSWELPVPATFVIAPDRRIHLSYVEADYRKRLEPDEIVAALADLAAARRQHRAKLAGPATAGVIA